MCLFRPKIYWAVKHFTNWVDFGVKRLSTNFAENHFPLFSPIGLSIPIHLFFPSFFLSFSPLFFIDFQLQLQHYWLEKTPLSRSISKEEEHIPLFVKKHRSLSAMITIRKFRFSDALNMDPNVGKDFDLHFFTEHATRWPDCFFVAEGPRARIMGLIAGRVVGEGLNKYVHVDAVTAFCQYRRDDIIWMLKHKLDDTCEKMGLKKNSGIATTITTRKFSPNDVMHIHPSVGKNVNVSFLIEHVTHWPNYFLVAEGPDAKIMGLIAGRVVGDGKDRHVLIEAVDAACGYGRLDIVGELMHKLEDICEKMDEAYFIELFVKASDSGSIKLYEQLGYGNSGGMSGNSELRMSKVLALEKMENKQCADNN